MGWFRDLFKKEEVVEEPEIPAEDYEVVHLLESYDVERKDLELDKIDSTSETIISYAGGLIKDVSSLSKIKEASELAFVFSKVKRLSENALELNNLLDQLVSYYFDPILEVLKKVDEKKDVKRFIKRLEKQKVSLEDLAKALNSFIVYYGVLDPDKRDVEEIKMEFNDKKFRSDFLNLLTNVKDDVFDLIIKKDIKNKLDVDILEHVNEEVFA